MRYLLQQSFVLPGLSVKQVFDDFGVAFESFVKDFPDFAGTARKRMKAFSTGERRIIEVYAVLASDSKFCLLDEPFSFYDAPTRAEDERGDPTGERTERDRDHRSLF